MVQIPTPHLELYMDILIGLEPRFHEIGSIAWDMAPHAIAETKSDTGNPESDIVTQVDRHIQELLLQAMAATQLVNCRLFAEEDTPSVKLFTGIESCVLTADPINGTMLLKRGLPTWNILIQLHGQRGPVYTFSLYPAAGWWFRLCDKGNVWHGKTMQPLKLEARKVIMHTCTTFDESCPVYCGLRDEGYTFRHKREISAVHGRTQILIEGTAAGVYMVRPHVYDGLVNLHLAELGQHEGDYYLSTYHLTDRMHLRATFLDPADPEKRLRGSYSVHRRA